MYTVFINSCTPCSYCISWPGFCPEKIFVAQFPRKSRKSIEHKKLLTMPLRLYPCFKCNPGYTLRLYNPSRSSRSMLDAPVRVSDYLDSSLAKNQFSLLQDRSLVRIKGADATKFLQGLTTNQMTKIERGGDGILTAFLNAQVTLCG